MLSVKTTVESGCECMREDIKKRIELIRDGKVPNGYKLTKVGIIPDEWEILNLSSFLKENKELSNDINKYPLYSSSRKGLLRQSEYYVNKEAMETNLGYKIVPNGFVTYRHMSDDDIFFLNINNTGSDILVSSEYPVFITEDMSLTFLIENLNNMPRFRYFCRAQKMGGTRTRLYFSSLKKYKMPMPQLKEQQKIAKILKHCDKVINLKQQLIEEEKNRKKWLMQNLLKQDSKFRPTNFYGLWKNVKLKDCLKVKHGRNQKQIECSSGIYPILASGGEIGRTNNPLYSKPSVLIGRKGTIDKPVYRDTPFWTVDTLFYTDIKKNICPKFMYYLFWTIQWNKYRESTGVPSLSASVIENIEVAIPSDFIEQQAIANTLSASDKKTDLLEQDLQQWQQKKKSLMQLLLTGIVRVPV